MILTDIVIWLIIILGFVIIISVKLNAPIGNIDGLENNKNLDELEREDVLIFSDTQRDQKQNDDSDDDQEKIKINENSEGEESDYGFDIIK